MATKTRAGHRTRIEADVRGVVTGTRGVPGRRPAREPVIHDAEIEQMFQATRRGTDPTVTALGDPMYVRRFRFPKWNIEPTVLQEPRIALRHWSDLGLPRSKHAHALRAEFFRALQHRFDEEHQRLLAEAEAAYGAHGPLISAGLREHWPALVKDRIRFVAQQGPKVGDAAAFHEYLATTRSPVFH